MFVADSLNPNLPDAESKNVARFCRDLIDKVEAAWVPYKWIELPNWKGFPVLYPRDADFSQNGKITDFVKFIKWEAKAFKDLYIKSIKGYILQCCRDRPCVGHAKQRVIVCDCVTCCIAPKCHNPVTCLCTQKACGKCCKDRSCGVHMKNKRKRLRNY